MDNGYQRHEWLPNEPITTLKLNNIEAGIEALHNMENDNTLERATNKITSGVLSEENTNDQYPTVKVVWDSFQKIGEDNLTKYAGLNSQSEYLMNIQCYYDDKVTIKNLNDIYLVDENNNLTNKKVSLSELIDIYFQFSPWIDGLANQYTSSNFSIDFKYIEPNIGKIISNINNNIYCNLCARPPRKMEFVNLDENDTIYQNGATLTISEIRDNLIFYAQDGYEWSYEQDGQTKKYADFLNDSDFSFGNGEQSIQLQITDDNALSESQTLTINCNRTYGLNEFLQTINFSINIPIIINRTQPIGIRLLNPPTKLKYLKGKDTSPDFSGIEVQIICENNTPFISNNYINGIIPLNELNISKITFNTAQDDNIISYYGYTINWTSSILKNENNEFLNFSITIENTDLNNAIQYSTCHAATMRIDILPIKLLYNSEEYISINGISVTILDTKNEPYAGLKNGQPEQIDLNVSPNKAQLSKQIEYNQFEEQEITISWIDKYNNNNVINSKYNITITKPYPLFNRATEDDVITIIKKIHNNELDINDLDESWRNPIKNKYNNNLTLKQDTTNDLIWNKISENHHLLHGDEGVGEYLESFIWVPPENYYNSEIQIHGILIMQPSYLEIRMSTNNYISTDWSNSDIRTFLNTDFYNALDPELTNCFIPITVNSSQIQSSNSIISTEDKINLFSSFEIHTANLDNWPSTVLNKISLQKEKATVQYFDILRKTITNYWYHTWSRTVINDNNSSNRHMGFTSCMFDRMLQNEYHYLICFAAF